MILPAIVNVIRGLGCLFVTQFNEMAAANRSDKYRTKI